MPLATVTSTKKNTFLSLILILAERRSVSECVYSASHSSVSRIENGGNGALHGGLFRHPLSLYKIHAQYRETLHFAHFASAIIIGLFPVETHLLKFF